jgi:hypothetical protein
MLDESKTACWLQLACSGVTLSGLHGAVADVHSESFTVRQLGRMQMLVLAARISWSDEVWGMFIDLTVPRHALPLS